MEYKSYKNYLVYENGDVYSLYSNKLLKHDIDKNGYHSVTLFFQREKERIKVHRLIALLFLEVPSNWQELQINHLDGDKNNNHYSNLEWCTAYENNKHARDNRLNDISKSNHDRWLNKEWGDKVREKISQNCNNSHTHNPRFRYWIEDENHKNYSRTELSSLLKLAQSTTDRIIREAAQGKNHPSLIAHKITVTDLKS